MYIQKYDLSHPQFDGQYGEISRRAVINELISNRHVFETPIGRFFRQAWKYSVVGVSLLILVLGLMALQRLQVWDIAEKSTISAIYHGDKHDVKKNKAEAFKKLKEGK